MKQDKIGSVWMYGWVALLLSLGAGSAFAAASGASDCACEPLTPLQVWAGYLSWSGTLKFIAGLLCVGFGLVLFREVVLKAWQWMRWILNLPKVSYTAAGWALSIAGLTSVLWAPLQEFSYITFGSSCAIIGMFFYTFGECISMWLEKFDRQGRKVVALTAALLLTLMLPIGVFGVLTGSVLTQLLLMVMLTLLMAHGLLLVVGLRDSSYYGTVSLLFMSVLGACGVWLFAAQTGALNQWVASLMGALGVSAGTGTAMLHGSVVYLGLWALCALSVVPALRWLCEREVGGYWVGQGWALGMLGLVFGVGLMPWEGAVLARQCAATGIALWALSKVLDIPYKGVVGWSSMGFGVSAGVYVLMRHIQSHPQMWEPYVLW